MPNVKDDSRRNNKRNRQRDRFEGKREERNGHTTAASG